MNLKHNVLVMTILLGLIACALTIKKPVGPDKTVTGVALYKQAEKFFKVRPKLIRGAKSGIGFKQISIKMGSPGSSLST